MSSRLRFAQTLALISAATGAACSAAVGSDSAVPQDGVSDTVLADVTADQPPAPDVSAVDVVDAGAGCPAQVPMTGQACSGMRTCDYTGGRCEITMPLLCNCVADPGGNTRWQCGPNCAIGPLMPPEFAA